ncbi:hypothetical protein COY13_01425 [Candidatus Roizmanbacteria bacterium CG_4_10_14_0_2_um_filter_36_35]|uniref:Uncharacterized protein n=2 Tax=Candidatus Roizmaniibacteriota TaxID=1752723 RepID=A0A2M7UAW0_9BACT|nr:MAG: hypothetical protein COY13_01425 [Candidatus Roizmanbacteria bacterium CG_4_10_14_0_2_um_filter_36_35]
MAEIAAAPISVTAEARAVRAGGAIGGVPELAKLKLSEWFNTAKTEVAKRIGLTKAEAKIKGNEQADPKIGELGVKVIKGVGDLVEKRGEYLEKSAYSRSARATDHENKLQALREKPVETAKKAAEYDIANTTLQMLDLPGRVGPGALSRIEQTRELAQRVIDTGSEKWHGFWAERDNRVAERDLDTAVKYGEGAKATHDFADKFEAIIGNKDGLSKLKESKTTIQNEVDQTAAVKEKLAGQFGEVLTKGANIGKGGAEQIKQQDVAEIKKQEQILKDVQHGVTAAGTK